MLIKGIVLLFPSSDAKVTEFASVWLWKHELSRSNYEKQNESNADRFVREMNPFANYIDRQKAGLGSSEKSQKVHSANWKEEIQLRKELYCLNRQEEQRVSRISSDQRLVVHRFHRKLSRSVEVAQNHEKLVENYDKRHQRWKESQNSTGPREKMSPGQLRCLSANPKPPVPKFRRAKSCEPPRLRSDEYMDKSDVIPRPMTALERRNRRWERQLNNVTQRLNRARSAPARSHLYKVPEFSVSENNFAVKDKKGNRFRKPAMFEIDMEQVRRARERELARQREAVNVFLKTIEPLELEPWRPFSEQQNANGESEVVNADGNKNADTNSARGRKISVKARVMDVEYKGKPFSAWTW